MLVLLRRIALKRQYLGKEMEIAHFRAEQSIVPVTSVSSAKSGIEYNMDGTMLL